MTATHKRTCAEPFLLKFTERSGPLGILFIKFPRDFVLDQRIIRDEWYIEVESHMLGFRGFKTGTK